MQELLNPSDSLERQRDKLLKICSALIRKVEQKPSDQSSSFAQFERAALLDAQVRERTADLERAMDMLNESNAKLADASQEAEKSRAILNDAIESVDEGLALFDSSERLILFNSRFCEQLSDVQAALQLGMSFESFASSVSRSLELHLPVGETREDWLAQRLDRHRKERVVFDIALTDYRWMQVSEHRTSEGGIAIVQTDISDVMRKQHRERDQLVSDQAKMLRATLDHLAQGVCIFDRNAKLVGWNRELERMIRVPVRYARLGTPFSKILEFMRGQLKLEEAQSRAGLIEWSERTTDRQPINFELNDDSGRIFSVFAQEMPDRGFVMSLTDVTRERTAANTLRDLNKTLELRVGERTQELGAALRKAELANETKTRFVAAASHDLLQPLSAAKLYLATLQDAGQSDHVTLISQKAESALKGAEEIIEALLDISKLDAGHAAFDVRPFSLSTILQSLANEMTPIAEAKGLRLTLVQSSASVVSDPVYFRRVLQNLISNAIKYTDTGRILVGVRNRPGGNLTIEVHDTGPGIAAKDQARIFQEFVQLQDSHSGAKGIGLGLAIVERVCSALGHRLHLRSAPNEGSCFSVSLGHYTGDVVNLVPTRNDLSLDPATGGKMLLLVENDEALSHAMTLRLEQAGMHVVHAASGEEALDLLVEIELLPDVALIDYQLGSGMTGLDLHAELSKRYDAFPTFMLSADRSPDLKESCGKRGLPLIPKPIDIEGLLRALDCIFTQVD